MSFEAFVEAPKAPTFSNLMAKEDTTPWADAVLATTICGMVLATVAVVSWCAYRSCALAHRRYLGSMHAESVRWEMRLGRRDSSASSPAPFDVANPMAYDANIVALAQPTIPTPVSRRPRQTDEDRFGALGAPMKANANKVAIVVQPDDLLSLAV